MKRQRFFTLLNLTGLSVGSACFLMIYAYVWDELSYDKFHEKSDRIYRVNMTNIWIESNDMFGSTSPAVATAIRSDIPEAEHVTRLSQPFYSQEQIVTVLDPAGNQRTFEESSIFAADSSFFEVFSFEMIEGNPATALAEPNALVLTASEAKKYFPEQSAYGQTIRIGLHQNQKSYIVTGVLKDLPDQSHFHFDLLISDTSLPQQTRRYGSWIWTGFVTYVLLDENSDLSKVNQAVAGLPTKYVGEERAKEKNWTLALQNIEDIRLYSGSVYNRFGPTGSIDNVIIFASVAILILLLSIVNFMNLSTAQFAKRAKEIGIQKVLGSLTGGIRRQFLIEGLVYSTLAVVLGFGLAELVRPFFNQLAGKQISLSVIQRPELLLVIVGLSVVTGLLSSSYPAWFMTRFKIVEVLKGKLLQNPNRFNFRNVLVVFQFSIAIGLMVATLLIKDQLHFLQAQELGFDDENVLVISHLEWMEDRGKLFASTLENEGILQNVALSNAVPPNAWNQENLTPLNSAKTTDLAVTMIIADHHFLPNLGVELVAGRHFFEVGEGDANKIIINEECAIQMEWMTRDEDPEQLLGKQISYYGSETLEVVGIMKDFNFWSLEMPIEPLAILSPKTNIFRGDQRHLVAKLPPGNMEVYDKKIREIEQVWKRLSTNLPFEFEFIDESFDSAFVSQRRFSKVINAFTYLAIGIAVLGLVGLISFTTEQRTKEFGIRKVLGASLSSLIGLISKEFIKLSGLALGVGGTLSWYFGSRWLEGFVYRTDISPMLFVAAAAVVLALIALICWSVITLNARKNPASVLRDE
ncbi:MAG: ABC transporter permease [Bacteroidota bacterium]